MSIILAIIALFVIGVGALTFMSSSETAAIERDYEPLQISSLMIILGMFCLVFFLVGISEALGAALLSAAVLFIVHSINSYANAKAYKFENSKLHEAALPGKGADAAVAGAENDVTAAETTGQSPIAEKIGETLGNVGSETEDAFEVQQ